MRISVEGTRLFIEVFGQQHAFTGAEMAARPTLIGLHGGPGVDGTTLRHHLAALSDVAQVIVPDQRGHGRSGTGAPTDWNLPTWARDVHQLCEVLDIHKPALLGQSFGGFVAQQYASTYPEDIAGLVLVSTAARYPGAQEVIARARELAGDETAEALRRNIDSPTEEPSAEDQQLLQSLYERRKDPDLEGLARHVIKTPEVAHQWVPEARRTMDLRRDLRSVQCPTLVLVGELDPLNPPALAAEVIDAIPDGRARLEVIPDAAHRVLVDNPEHTLRSIRAFVSDLGGP
ncbi:MAG: alpha/beta hydrolase [Actinobacteria bacterium]|nr:alpha/beta hydrolase [Actinomycetota bacterium]